MATATTVMTTIRRKKRIRCRSFYGFLLLTFLYTVGQFFLLVILPYNNNNNGYGNGDWLSSSSTTTSTTTAIMQAFYSNNNNKIDDGQYVGDSDDDVDDDESFSSCLLFNDDNHFLIEWIAYHYTVLPLRRLVIAIDPLTRYPPIEILKRFQMIIPITVWNDDDYFPKMIRSSILRSYNNGNNNNNETTESESSSATTKLVILHRHRQRMFYWKCMELLKEENRTWITFLDTDELLFPNYQYFKYRNQLLPLLKKYDDDDKKSKKEGKKKERHNNNTTTTTTSSRSSSSMTTILKLLRRFKNYKTVATSPCVGLPRLLFGGSIQEEEEENTSTTNNNNNNSSNLTTILKVNSTDFMSLRWKLHGGGSSSSSSTTTTTTTLNKAGKAMIDISRVSSKLIYFDNINTHRPIKTICTNDIRHMWLPIKESPFVVHHYIGTQEQFLYRDDIRQDKRTLQNYNNITNTILLLQQQEQQQQTRTTTTSLWLQNFVTMVGGYKNASFLLKGVGQVQGGGGGGGKGGLVGGDGGKEEEEEKENRFFQLQKRNKTSIIITPDEKVNYLLSQVYKRIGPTRGRSNLDKRRRQRLQLASKK